jgi:hypothetical protein
VSISIDGPQRSERDSESCLSLRGSTTAIEQRLNGPFNLLVLTFARVFEHDRPVSVDDVLRRPILIVVAAAVRATARLLNSFSLETWVL